MNRLGIAIATLVLMASGSLAAQQRRVEANVPFDFYVGNSELMPAGQYRIAPCAKDIVKVTHCESGLSVMHLVNYTGEPGEEQAKLVFHKYGENTYFLRQVHSAHSWSGAVLPQSKHEKKVMEDLATVRTFETIMIPTPPEPDKK